MSIKNFMAQDHRNCDLLFAKTETAASTENWGAAEQAFDEFTEAMERHLGVEEEVLFPAFETATGIVTGPTEMMRMEHEQMRELIGEMRDALEQHQADDYLGNAETLMILMQQHNIKEEQILYNMMDQHLSDDSVDWKQSYKNWNKG